MTAEGGKRTPEAGAIDRVSYHLATLSLSRCKKDRDARRSLSHFLEELGVLMRAFSGSIKQSQIVLIVVLLLMTSSGCSQAKPSAEQSNRPSASIPGGPAIGQINELAHERYEVLRLARLFVVALTTYDAPSLQQQRQIVLSMSTDGFREQFEQLTGSSTFAKALVAAGPIARGKVVTLSVSSLIDGHATVGAVVAVIFSSKTVKVPTVQRRTITMEWVRTLSGWKVSSLRVFPTLYD